jgi:hypothetical protein
LSSFFVRFGRSDRKTQKDSIPLRVSPAYRSAKFMLSAALVLLGFAGGWALERRLGPLRPPTPTELLAGTVKRCGDPQERVCSPDEFSDDEFRLLCAEGLVSAQWMYERGFDTHETVGGRCELSQEEERILLASMGQIDSQQLPSEGTADLSPRISGNSRPIGVRVR